MKKTNENLKATKTQKTDIFSNIKGGMSVEQQKLFDGIFSGKVDFGIPFQIEFNCNRGNVRRKKISATPVIDAIRGQKSVSEIEKMIKDGVSPVYEVYGKFKSGPLAFAPLHYDSENLIKLLLDNGIDVNSKNDNNSGILVFMTGSGVSPDFYKYLIDKGADINGSDKWGMTPLLGACINNSKKNVEILLGLGANVYAETEAGKTMLNGLLSGNINEDTIEIMKLLIEKGVDIYTKDKDGNSLLHTLCMINFNDQCKNYVFRSNVTKVAKFLVDNGVEIDGKNSQGITPLIFLQSHKINGLTEPTIMDLTVFLLSYKQDGHKVDINYINEYMGTEKEDKKFPLFMRNALGATLFSGNVELSKVLLDNGANLGIKLNGANWKNVPLPFLAIYGGSIATTKHLIEEEKIDIYQTDSCKMNALHYSAMSGNVEMLKLALRTMVEVRKNSKSEKDRKIITNKIAKYINAQGENGDTPMLTAIKYHGAVEHIAGIVDVLTRFGTDIDIEDKNGKTVSDLVEECPILASIIENN